MSLTRTPTLTLTLTLTLNQDERNLYLIEEFVQLGNLSTHIKKNHKLPNDTARFYAAQIVMAIQFLHSEHIIYRDLNPENVMLDRGHYVKLVDFGLAKGLNLDDPTARTWTLCGTPEYIYIYIYMYIYMYMDSLRHTRVRGTGGHLVKGAHLHLHIHMHIHMHIHIYIQVRGTGSHLLKGAL